VGWLGGHVRRAHDALKTRRGTDIRGQRKRRVMYQQIKKSDDQNAKSIGKIGRMYAEISNETWTKGEEGAVYKEVGGGKGCGES